MYMLALLLDRLTRSFRLLLHSRSPDRLFSSVHPCTSLRLVEPRSINPRARVTNSHRATIRALSCLGNEKTIDNTMLRPRGRSKRKVRRENTRRGSERGRIVPPYSIKGEFTRVRSSRATSTVKGEWTSKQCPIKMIVHGKTDRYVASFVLNDRLTLVERSYKSYMIR